jgi:hypothetical protein
MTVGCLIRRGRPHLKIESNMAPRRSQSPEVLNWCNADVAPVAKAKAGSEGLVPLAGSRLIP